MAFFRCGGGKEEGELHGAILTVTGNTDNFVNVDCTLSFNGTVQKTKKLSSGRSVSFDGIMVVGVYSVKMVIGGIEYTHDFTVTATHIIKKQTQTWGFEYIASLSYPNFTVSGTRNSASSWTECNWPHVMPYSVIDAARKAGYNKLRLTFNVYSSTDSGVRASALSVGAYYINNGQRYSWGGSFGGDFQNYGSYRDIINFTDTYTRDIDMITSDLTFTVYTMDWNSQSNMQSGCSFYNISFTK